MLNDIKVIYSKYKENIKIDVIDDYVVLFNHDNISPNNYYGIFTGIKLLRQEAIEIKVYDLDFKELKFILSYGYLYVDIEDTLGYNKPVCLIEFRPKNNFMDIDRFKPHLIEKRS